MSTTEAVTIITTGNGAIPGVVKGDYIRWKSGTTVFGAPAYAEAEIAAVNADELTIKEADLSTLSKAKDFAIVRKSYSKLDLVNYLIASKCVADRRATVVYADDAVFGG